MIIDLDLQPWFGPFYSAWNELLLIFFSAFLLSNSIGPNEGRENEWIYVRNFFLV